MSSRCTLLAAVAFIGLGASAFAQAPAMPQAPGVYKLQLKTDPQLKYGKIAAVEGLATKTGQRLAVSDLSVMQPVQLTLQALDKTDDLRLELSKFAMGGQSARSGSTRGTGRLTFKFRTQGDLQIKITSPEGARFYRLMVWAGDELMPPMPTAFVPMDTYLKHQGPAAASAKGGGGTAGAAPVTTSSGPSAALWVIAGALVVIVALLGVMVLKRGRK